MPLTRVRFHLGPSKNDFKQDGLKKPEKILTVVYTRTGLSSQMC